MGTAVCGLHSHETTPVHSVPIVSRVDFENRVDCFTGRIMIECGCACVGLCHVLSLAVDRKYSLCFVVLFC